MILCIVDVVFIKIVWSQMPEHNAGERINRRQTAEFVGETVDHLPAFIGKGLRHTEHIHDFRRGGFAQIPYDFICNGFSFRSVRVILSRRNFRLP